MSVQKEFLQRVTAEYPGLPCFLFGHSTGGAIALKVLIFQISQDMNLLFSK